MTEIIELDQHVFEATIEPDTPGYCRRTYRVEQLSGPPLTRRQWKRLARLILREFRNAGAKVHGWKVIESPPPGGQE